MKKFLLFLALVVTSVFVIHTPSAHATGTLLPMCDVNGACNYQYNYSWGYCQWQTYQTAKTFTVAVEIGINSGNVSDVCYVPFAFGGNITSLEGNTNYTPWTVNLSSMFLNVRACTGAAFSCIYPAEQEHLITHKYTVKGNPQAIPFSKTLATPMFANGFMVVFNDDLVADKPTTMNLTFSGTFQ